MKKKKVTDKDKLFMWLDIVGEEPRKNPNSIVTKSKKSYRFNEEGELIEIVQL